MKKGYKITLWVVGVIVVIAIIAMTIGVTLIERKVEGIVKERLTQIGEERHMSLSCADVDFHLLSGRLRIDSLHVAVFVQDSVHGDSAFVDGLIPRIDIGRIHWRPLLVHRNLRIDEIGLTEPQLSAYSAQEALKYLSENKPEKSSSIPLQQIDIKRFRIKNAKADLARKEDKWHVTADSLSLRLNNLSYCFADSLFTYSDSLYRVSVGPLSFCSADGLMAMYIRSLETEDSGAVILEDFRCGHTDKREQHALHCGKKPSVWMHVDIETLRTSPVNLVRAAREKQFALDSLQVCFNEIELYRDNQYPPVKPYTMLQEKVLQVTTPFSIAQTNLSMKKFIIRMTPDGSHVGQIVLKQAQTQIAHLSNTEGSTADVRLKAKIDKGGKTEGRLQMKMDKPCSFDFWMRVSDLTSAALYDFMHPLLGVEVKGDIHSVEWSTHGDKKQSKSEFCMLYDTLSLHVDKQAPLPSLAKFGGLINAFASVTILQHNPSHAGGEPRSYTVELERNIWKPMTLYFFAPVNEGVLRTVLPATIATPILKGFKQK